MGIGNWGNFLLGFQFFFYDLKRGSQQKCLNCLLLFLMSSYLHICFDDLGLAGAELMVLPKNFLLLQQFSLAIFGK